MANFKLTTGSDILDGTADADNFYGWPDNPGGGASGGYDYLDAMEGNDHLYIDSAAQDGTFAGGGGIDTVHVRVTLGKIEFEEVEILELTPNIFFPLRISATVDQLNTFTTIKSTAGGPDRIKLLLTERGTIDFSTKLEAGDTIDIDSSANPSANDGVTITGTLGDDIFKGSGAADSFTSGNGKNTLIASAGEDTFIGGSGNDLLDFTGTAGGTDQQSIDGGGGIDTLVVVEANLGSSTFVNVERLHANSVWLTLASLKQFKEIANREGEAGMTQISVSTNGASLDLSSKVIAGHGIDLRTNGGVNATLTDAVDVFIGDWHNDTVHGGGGKDRFVFSGDASGHDEFYGDGGGDLFRFTYRPLSLPPAGAGLGTVNGGSGEDTLEADGSITALTLSSVEHLRVVEGVRASVSQLKAFGTIKSALGSDATLKFYLEGPTKRIDFASLEGLDPGKGKDKGIYISGDYAAAINAVGTAGDDTLFGSFGNDTLEGGGGADELSGRWGNDTYVLGSSKSGADTIIESTSTSDLDTIISSITRSLGYSGYSLIENLTLTGSDKIDGTGNGLANLIAGNGADNSLKGGDGDDTLLGGGGKDTLDGSSGLDVASYLGSKKAVVVDLDDASKNTNDAKADTYKSIAGVIGTAHDDNLYGTSDDNYFDGAGGDDTFNGRGGADTVSYRLADAKVTVDLSKPSNNKGEAKGDTLASIEGLAGTIYDDKLKGDAKDNTLAGYRGHDTLTGGSGADRFLFELMGDTNTDVITDFTSKTDKIVLLQSFFSTLGDKVDKGELTVGAGHVPDEPGDRLFFDTTTSTLWFDRDGTDFSGTYLIATLTGVTKIVAGDFELV